MARALREELLATVNEPGTGKIAVHLKFVKSISSSCFLRLLRLNSKLRETGGRLVLCGLSPLLRQAFQATRLIPSKWATIAPFRVQPDVPAAIAELHLKRAEDESDRLFPLSFDLLFTLSLNDLLCVAGF